MNKANVLVLIIKIAVTSGVSWELAKWLGSKHPFLAPLSVILCIQASFVKSLKFSWYRLFGTVLGVLATMFVGSYFKVTGLSLMLFLFIGLFVSMWVNANEVFIRQVAISILLVFYFVHQTKPYAIDRIRDTLIGVCLAVLVHLFIFPPHFTRKGNTLVLNFITQLTDHLQTMVQWIHGGCQIQEGEWLKEEISQCLTAINKAGKDFDDAIAMLKYNPFSRKERVNLQHIKTMFYDTKKGYSYLEDVLETFMFWSSQGKMEPMDRQEWTNQLGLIKAFFEQWKKELEKNPLSKEIPQITVPVTPPNGCGNQQCNITLFHFTTKFIQEITTQSS